MLRKVLSFFFHKSQLVPVLLFQKGYYINRSIGCDVPKACMEFAVSIPFPLVIHVFFGKNAKIVHFKDVIIKKEIKNKRCIINFCSQFCHLPINEKSKGKLQYVRELELAVEGQVFKNSELRLGFRSRVLKLFSSRIKNFITKYFTFRVQSCPFNSFFFLFFGMKCFLYSVLHHYSKYQYSCIVRTKRSGGH